jgi:hypothetical protein
MVQLRNKFGVASVMVLLLTIASANTLASSSNGELSVAAANARNLGTIKGIVKDQTGNPIADATVAIFRLGTSKLLKQVRSASDGSFLAKILPGKYTILAVAEGFNPVTLAEVEVNRASLSSYGFKLERSGSGNTLPEKRLDRNNPKWNIRSAQTSRSIYQNQDGELPTGEVDETLSTADESNFNEGARKSASVAETFVAATDRGMYAGVNYATLLPISERAEILLAAQGGVGRGAPLRFETQLKFRPVEDHQLRLNAGFARLGDVRIDGRDETLGQLSIRATDEWKVREGIVLVYGLDYSKFVGAGDDFSLSPRIGFQYDLDSKTRMRSAFTSFTEERTWSSAIELEGSEVTFREPAAIQDIAIENSKPVMNRSSRFEIGIERVLDNRSSVELTAFFDTTFSRGFGFSTMNLSPTGEEFSEFVGNQNGNAQGLRLVYSRRINGIFSTSAGYSFGNGQQISQMAITSPDRLFENDLFHTVFGEVEADFDTGTSVRTIFRLSPEATVFAIDPFQGRLAIYDPSLSVLVTQALPTLGLPFKARATLDARNVLGFQSGVAGEEGSLRLNSQRRALRGSIMVRF